MNHARTIQNFLYGFGTAFVMFPPMPPITPFRRVSPAELNARAWAMTIGAFRQAITSVDREVGEWELRASSAAGAPRKNISGSPA